MILNPDHQKHGFSPENAGPSAADWGFKEKYTDPKEMNAKIWELYRRENQSYGGSLPMILQMPFFCPVSGAAYVVELKMFTFMDSICLLPTRWPILNFLQRYSPLPYRLNIMPCADRFLFCADHVSGRQSCLGQGKMMEYLMPIMFLLFSGTCLQGWWFTG